MEGREPAAPGEIAVSKDLADRNGIDVGDRIGLETAHGTVQVNVVGLVDFGGSGSAGGYGFTMTTLFPHLQRWYDQRGKVSQISVAARAGVSPERLVDAIKRLVPADVKVQTGRQNADENAKDISNSINSFLGPALLAFAGAALLVGAFIIFNTFSISVAERTREFASLRTLGATRGQVLRSVPHVEALAIGVTASVLGPARRTGLRAADWRPLSGRGHRHPDLRPAPDHPDGDRRRRRRDRDHDGGRDRPCRRERRGFPPHWRWRREHGSNPHACLDMRPTSRRWSLWAGCCCCSSGSSALAPRPASCSAWPAARYCSSSGSPWSPRYIVRPIAAAIGLPLERSFSVVGQLARENAQRNPGRTALTSAALMVGLGLVVFVAVFAAGLRPR